MKKTKLIVLLLLSALLPAMCSCSAQKAAQRTDVIRIAMLGDDEFYAEGGTLEAIALATEKVREEYGVTLELVLCDDDADYHKTIAYAQALAADPNIAAVIGKQEMDYIDTVADIFEAAQKPYIITSGCYNHTIEKGYKYLLADFINAKSAGTTMGRFVKERGYTKAAFCHSDTEYEEDELKGFQAELNDSATVLADTVVGPFTQEEFDIAYSRWKLLGIDVVCVSNYYARNSDVVRMLREKDSRIQVVSDYVMETDEDIEYNGAYMDGTQIVPLYINETAVSADVQQQFQEKYQMEMLEVAAQAYDLIGMLGEQLASGAPSAAQLMEGLKSETGYQGVCGTVRFDENGALVAQDCRLLVFTAGAFRLEDGKDGE